MAQLQSDITIREKNDKVTVKIGSTEKPVIIDKVFNKWQSLINVTAELINVPAGLIMRLNENDIEVFVSSDSPENPYKMGEKEALKHGLYCETVIGTQDMLLIPDATENEIWRHNNPDVEIDMISYLGLPINWPDGEAFGTICVLDNKKNTYNNTFIRYLKEVKQSIETDLELLTSQQNLNEANAELKRNNEIKNKFLSLISHDMRGSIGGLVELIMLMISQLEEMDKIELEEILLSIAHSANGSYQTLENMLEWSKNNMVHMRANKENIDLAPIIDSILDFFTQTIRLKNISIVKDYAPNICLFHVDRNMIEVILRNIISNAIKYNNPDGKVYIRLLCNNNTSIVEIEDTGIGMDENEQKKLFTYNEFSKNNSSRSKPSSGLGLLLTKDFLDKNDADIFIESKPEKGTIVRLEFQP